MAIGCVSGENRGFSVKWCGCLFCLDLCVLVARCVNDLLMLQNSWLPLPSGFTFTLKTKAADSLGTLITSHISTISQAKRPHQSVCGH
jgi:hypothetical protein